MEVGGVTLEVTWPGPRRGPGILRRWRWRGHYGVRSTEVGRLAVKQSPDQVIDGTVYECPQCDVAPFLTKGLLIEHRREEHHDALPFTQRIQGAEQGPAKAAQNGSHQSTFSNNDQYRIGNLEQDIPERELYNLIYGDETFMGHSNRDNRKSLPETYGTYCDREENPTVKGYLSKIYNIKVAKAEDSFFLMHEKTENKYAGGKPEVRGTQRYKKKIDRKINGVKEYLEENPQPATLLTLTPRNGKGDNPVDGLRKMKGVANDIIAYIRQLRDWFDIDKYYWTLEPQKSGNPHIHMLILGENLESQLNPHETLGNWWIKHGYGESQGVDVEGIDSHQSKEAAAAYMVKYLNKNIKKDWFNGMIYLAGSRTLQFSERLNQILVGLLRSESKVKEENGEIWIPIGIFRNWKRVKDQYSGDIGVPPPKVLYEEDKLTGNWLISKRELEQRY